MCECEKRYSMDCEVFVTPIDRLTIIWKEVVGKELRTLHWFYWKFVGYFVDKGSTVYIASLDIRKAFSGVTHLNLYLCSDLLCNWQWCEHDFFVKTKTFLKIKTKAFFVFRTKTKTNRLFFSRTAPRPSDRIRSFNITRLNKKYMPSTTTKIEQKQIL